jgi:hypothetical protein
LNTNLSICEISVIYVAVKILKAKKVNDLKIIDIDITVFEDFVRNRNHELKFVPHRGTSLAQRVTSVTQSKDLGAQLSF